MKGIIKKIRKDVRGTIVFNRFKKDNFNVIFTKKGFLRGGEIHPKEQRCLILDGKFRIKLIENDKEKILRKKKGDVVIIPKNCPHIFEALSDSLLIEWWDGKFEATYYMPYRESIQKQIKNKKL